jgi:hypothetical protein
MFPRNTELDIFNVNMVKMVIKIHNYYFLNISGQPDPDGQTGEMRVSILWHLTITVTPVGARD